MADTGPEQFADYVRRLAYADPPYLGCCARYDHRHEEPWGCWDEPATHEALIASLAEYDGWALSGTSGSLRTLLPFCPDDVRVAAWVKPWCSWKTVNPAYAWEPVIFRSARGWSERGGRSVPHARDWFETLDWIAASATTRRPVIGAKPDRFCRWVLDLMGYVEGDELVDIFPGSGVMDRVLTQPRLAL